MREGLKLLSGFSGTASYLLWNLGQEAEWTRAGPKRAPVSFPLFFSRTSAPKRFVRLDIDFVLDGSVTFFVTTRRKGT